MTTKDAAAILAEMLCTDHRVEEADLIESGADELILEQFWRSMRPHLAHMRGFVPLGEQLGRQSAPSGVSLGTHVVKVHGAYYEPRIYASRKGSLVLIVNRDLDGSVMCPANTKYTSTFVKVLAAYKPGLYQASLHLWLVRRLVETWQCSLQAEATDLERRLEALKASSQILDSIDPILANP